MSEFWNKSQEILRKSAKKLKNTVRKNLRKSVKSRKRKWPAFSHNYLEGEWSQKILGPVSEFWKSQEIPGKSTKEMRKISEKTRGNSENAGKRKPALCTIIF